MPYSSHHAFEELWSVEQIAKIYFYIKDKHLKHFFFSQTYPVSLKHQKICWKLSSSKEKKQTVK